MQPPYLQSEQSEHWNIESLFREEATSKTQGKSIYPLTPTSEKIMEKCPELILGSSKLLEYDSKGKTIRLTADFMKLLSLLCDVNLMGKEKVVDPKVLEVGSLEELDVILQKKQGEEGLMRGPIERWQMSDSEEQKKISKDFDELFKKLGFVARLPLDDLISVDFGVCFGARVERMQLRLNETVTLLKKNLLVKDKLFLLGSTRFLEIDEFENLKKIYQNVNNQKVKKHWEKIFKIDEAEYEKFKKTYNKEANQQIDEKKMTEDWKKIANVNVFTEANAYLCLWECLVPEDVQLVYKERLICIKATEVGATFEDKGYRPTTESSLSEWLTFIAESENKSPSFFALAELPYIRLLDGLRKVALTKDSKANLQELIGRIAHMKFTFGVIQPQSTNKISIVLDEFARNIRVTKDVLKYIEMLSKSSKEEQK